MKRLIQRIFRFLRHEDGQGLTEYGMILVLVSIVSIGVLTAMGESLVGLFERVIPLPGTGS